MIRLLSGLLLAMALLAFPAAAMDESGHSRVGHTFWVWPKDRPFSPDFYRSPAMDERVAIEGKTRFKVLDVIAVGRLSDKEPVYRVRFADGTEAYIQAAMLESELYVDPGPGSEIDFSAAGFLSPQAYLFAHKSIFSEDPDLIAARLRNEGPRRLLLPEECAPDCRAHKKRGGGESRR